MNSPGLHLFTSNRYELLRARLLDDLAAAPGDPLRSQQVIIPSQAVRRDVQLALAEAQGVAMGVDFPFLAQWLWERMAEHVAVEAVSPFAPARLTWRLWQMLGDAAFCAAHPRLAAYLVDADAQMRYDLAARLAGLLEQLITYRPDWLAAWSAEQPAFLPGATAQQRADEAWQAALWRRITSELGTARQHPSVAFFAAIEKAGAAPAGLPERAHIFALSTLPPLYLEILKRLSRWIDIRLYLHNPSRAYWHEIIPEKRRARLAAAGQDQYLEAGHPLLAAWGRQTQALFGLLLDAVDADEDTAFFANHELTESPTLLHSLQDSMLDLELPAPGSLALADDDRSIECHVGHSLTRELEILHDQLLQAFAADPGLQPSEVLVATPDLESAAPLIDAVFASARKIPYVITGRGETQSNPVAVALLALLDTAASRCTASEVFALLRQPLIAAAFRLAEADLDRLQAALHDAGVHWGLDAAHRAAQQQPGDARHTWRDALARLLLGYASGDDHVFAGILPAGHLEGSAALPLGALWRFLNVLDQLNHALAQAQSGADWLALWQGVIADCIAATPGTVEERRSVLQTIAGLAAEMAEADNANPSAFSTIPAEVARAALSEALTASTRGGVPTGSVTFTVLPSLRGLPYRVVCLLGLSDGSFPGRAAALEFDLLPLHTRPGDRQRREDERNLFLDLILAARNRLIITWTGRSQRDNSPLPPAVPVAELLDFLLAATAVPRSRLVVDHPLQAFSPEYFGQSTEPRLHSFDSALCAALQAASKAAPTVAAVTDESDDEADDDAADSALPGAPLFALPLPAPEMRWRQPSPQALADVLRHPARGLLRRRLGLNLALGAGELEDEDPLLGDRETEWALADRLLPAALNFAATDINDSDASNTPTALIALAGADPQIPAGSLGERFAAREAAAAYRLAQRLAPFLAEPAFEQTPFTIACTVANEDWQIVGLPGMPPSRLSANGLLLWRAGAGGAADLLSGWIAHLCLCATLPPEVLPQTRLLLRQGSVRFLPVAAPLAHLTDLLEAYRSALCAPLPFHPRPGWALLQNDAAAASKVWNGDQQRPGLLADPWWSLALRGSPGLDHAAFAEWSERLLAPLQAHLERLP